MLQEAKNETGVNPAAIQNETIRMFYLQNRFEEDGLYYPS